MLEPLCKQVTGCVHTINNTDTANKNINSAFRNVPCETTDYTYPRLIVNPISMNSVKCETKKTHDSFLSWV